MSQQARFFVGVVLLLSGQTASAQTANEQTGVSMARVLSHAERHAPLIQIGRARLRTGVAETVGAKPLLPEDPELEVGLGPRLSSGGHTLELEASIQQRLEISGARGLRVVLAQRTRARLQAELARLRWEVHRKVHAAYHEALVTRQRVTAAAHMVAFANKLLEITKKRHAAGAISLLNVRVAEGEAAQAAQREIQAKSAYQVACLRIAEVSGWSGAAPEPAGALDPPRAAPSLGKLVALAQRHHPGLQARAAEVEEARAGVKLAKRETFPKPVLGVTYGREAEIAGATNHILLGTLGFSLPIWRRNQGKRARAGASAAVARARYRALKQTLPTQVARAARSLDAAVKRIAVYGQEVMPAFKRSLEMIGRAYSEGKVDILQVMVARGRFLEIQRGTLDAYVEYHKAHAALEEVVGVEIWTEDRQ